MSTRRPRIKPVAALPPRRKNAESSDGTKNKPQQTEDAIEKPLKSPRSPRTYSKSDDKPSPGLFSPPLLPLVPTSTAVTQSVSSSNTESPKVNGHTTPVPEKAMQVSVITPTPNFKNRKNVFASPSARNSPDRKSLMSPPPATDSPRAMKSVDVAQKQPSAPLHIVDSSLEKEHSSSNIVNETVNRTPSSASQRTDIPDDYSIPSVPESVTEESVMDSIVPLQPEKSAPNPIELLKNEIISEYAEVLFDPIVPLPSPSKVRPKLRPVPRLAPHRRNSIQGSASESEDESRRALLSGAAPPARQRHDSHHQHHSTKPARIRHDSASSAIQPVLPPPAPALSPVKDKHFNKARRQEMSKRMWRRRRDTVKRDSLTMYDLIFYNPTTNPLIPDQEEVKAKEENAKEAERAALAPEPMEAEEEPPAAAPVPQIKLGPNGEIMLDEKSLVIKQSDANRKVSSVVREGTWAGSGCGRYTRTARTADWSMAETVRFYRALAAIGTDFTLMAPLFPDRTRRDLKLKFKKEERLNGAQVDKALRSATAWDATRLLDEFAEERQMAAQQTEKEQLQLVANKKAEKERLKANKELRIRTSKGARALEFKMDKNANSTEMTADDFARRAKRSRAKQSQERLPKQTPKEPGQQAGSSFATLTLLRRPTSQPQTNPETIDIATLSRATPTPEILDESVNVPSNIETGSLVVLRVNNPVESNKTMLQTYISHGDGKLTPIALPPTLLNSVVGYMKKGTNGNSSESCSPFTSPNNDSRSGNSSVLNVSPNKRARIGSWDITTLL